MACDSLGRKSQEENEKEILSREATTGVVSSCRRFAARCNRWSTFLGLASQASACRRVATRLVYKRQPDGLGKRPGPCPSAQATSLLDAKWFHHPLAGRNAINPLLLLRQHQRSPQGRIAGDRVLGTERERVPAEFPVHDGKAESKSPVLDRIKARDRDCWN